MELTANYSFDASPERVFDLLTDPVVVASCLPGCERLEPVEGTKYRAVLSMGIASITGRYEGTVELLDLNRPASYRLAVDGKGAPGFVKGEGRIVLEADGPGTLVKVSGQAQVGGAIARVGQRLVAGAAKLAADRFFACIGSKVGS
ncbi:MAG: carbon monoxide dehydrogenase subunit G [Bryobacteraceae bacterium]